MNAEDNIARSAQLQNDSTRIGVDFLRTDIETALIFANAALNSSDDPEKRARNQTNARNGYDTVVRLSERLELTDSERKDVDSMLAELKSVLERLGERF